MEENLGPTPRRWDPAHPEVHVSGDPDCECWAHTPEFRRSLLRAEEDVRSGRVFSASVEDLERIMDGTLTLHDIHLREALVAFELAEPHETGALA